MGESRSRALKALSGGSRAVAVEAMCLDPVGLGSRGGPSVKKRQVREKCPFWRASVSSGEWPSCSDSCESEAV